MNDFALTRERPASPTARKITAYRDLGCFSAVKYIYKFSTPIRENISQFFAACDVKIFRFSAYAPDAKDLLKLKKRDEFQADLIVGGFTATVYFSKQTTISPRRLLDTFDQRLHNAGYGSVQYVAAMPPRCDQCRARHRKECC